MSVENDENKGRNLNDLNDPNDPNNEIIKMNCLLFIVHSINFSRGVVHRVENGWGLTKMAVVLLNGLLW